MEIRKARGKIDAIDAEIVRLFRNRFSVANEIGLLKKNKSLSVEDSVRDGEVLEKYKENSDGSLDEEFLEELVELILKYSKMEQGK